MVSAFLMGEATAAGDRGMVRVREFVVLNGEAIGLKGRLSDQYDSAILHLPGLTIQYKAAVPDEGARCCR